MHEKRIGTSAILGGRGLRSLAATACGFARAELLEDRLPDAAASLLVGSVVR